MSTENPFWISGISKNADFYFQKMAKNHFFQKMAKKNHFFVQKIFEKTKELKV